ncbi:NUDIX hydrolase [Lactiplantibacillus plantarum]|uniref:NUDIX hydrolase n=1 Tax=Lactiplantibacillus plantarum TaxID=1590 RepID=UPI000B40CCC4|nr:NUDIX domain-containing protein [Lactiplantibacillus plantarum]
MGTDYIRSLRKIVGHQPIILAFSGGILENDKHEILLQRRTDFDAWGLPGGAIEFGETAPEACKREYLEETGLSVEVNSLLGVTTNHIQEYPNGDVAQTVVIEFVVRLIGGHENVTSPETSELQYFAQGDLPEIFNKQHYRSIQRYFDKKFPYYD